MALVKDDGITPKTRPVPQQAHLDQFQKEADEKRAIEIVFARLSHGKDTWKEGQALYQQAKEEVASAGAAAILAEHDKPSEADLDVVADEEKAKEATAPKESKSWGKPTTTKKQ